MEKKLWRERRRWLWGCKFALNKTQCVDAIENFVNKAEGRLKKMCPHKICSKVGFCPPVNCTSSSTPHDHIEMESVPMMELTPAMDFVPTADVQVEPELLDDKCTYCEEAVNYIKILLGNKETMAEIKTLIVGMCSQAGPLKETCIELVDQNLDEIVKKLAHMDTKDTCVYLHLCNSPSSFQSFISAAAASISCNSCKQFAKSTVMPQISARGSERDFAIGLCHTLGRNDLLCHKHLSNFLTIAKAQFSLEGREGMEDNLCKPFCQPGMTSIWDNCLSKEAKMADAPKTTEAPTTAVPTTTEPPTTAPPPPPQPPVCKRCKTVIGMIKEELEAKLGCLENGLTLSCRLIPPLKGECEAAVNAFFTPLKQKIAKVNPELVCVKAGVCNPTERLLEMPNLSLIPSRELGYTGGRGQQLADVFGGIGPVFPAADVFTKDLAKLDDGIIRIDMRKQSVPAIPSVHRADANAASQVLTMEASPKISEDATCTVCTYLVDDLKEHWSVEAKEELKALMMAGCAKLPVKQRDECMEFMAPKVNSFVHFVETIPTKEICQIAKACPSDSPVVISNKLSTNAMECYACKFAGDELKEVWSNPNVPSTINNTLHSLCLKLPGDYQAQCHGAIDQTFPVISGMIEDMDPTEVCASLGICESEERHLLGSNDCTWHLPAQVLCADWKRAKKCGKVDLCKKEVWGVN